MDDVTARAHGTRAAYLAGCTCLPCRAANAQYQAERRRRLAQGQELHGQAIPGHDTARLIRALRAEGFSAARLGALLGVHAVTVKEHSRSRPVEVRLALRVRALWTAFQPQIAAD